MKTRKRDEIDLFKAWVAARGGEVLAPTNEYEIVRFRGDGVTSIVYQKLTGQRTFTGRAQDAWRAFKAHDAAYRITKRPAKVQTHYNTGRPTPVVRTLIERDGDSCFYCDEPFGPDRPRTREHLVAITHGGPDHISNIFLACETCNIKAGHLSAPEKIRLREAMRAAGAGVAAAAERERLLEKLPTQGASL